MLDKARLLAAALTVGPILMSEMPVQASVPPPPDTGSLLMMWAPEEVACSDGARPSFSVAPDPEPGLAWGPAQTPPITLAFRIDPSGRPLGIVRQGTDYLPASEDVIPALAAARFAAGGAHSVCSVRFLPVRQPIASAPVELAMRYWAFNQAPPPPIWDRIKPAGATCFDPPPASLLQAWPDFKALPGTPGRRDWSMIGYDLDKGGKPAGARVISGAGQRALDAASLSAVRRSRFEKGARTGCLFRFYRNATTLAAPEPPAEDSFRPAGATCPRDLPYVRQPMLTFPESYRKRSIEGWAMLAYDVAPWGQIGNVRVLAAEPSAEFGDWATRVIGNATKPAGTTGYVGCVDRVLFRIGPTPKLLVSDGSSPVS